MCSTTSKVVIGVIVIAVCVTAIVLGVVLGTRGNDKCSSVGAPTNINFENRPEYNSVRVTWEYPDDNDDECEITYRIHYTIDGDTTGENEVTTTDLEYVIEDVAPCTELVVHIWAIISKSEKESEEKLEGNYVVPVTQLPAPSSIEFTVVENNLEISWEEPAKLLRCQLKYRIEIDTDEISIDEETVEGNSFSIPTNSFCLSVDVRITTIFDETDGETADSSYIDPGVTNLNIYNVESTNYFTVSWDEHVNQVRCSLSYRVLYRVLGVAEDVEIIHDAETLTASFPVEYCEEAYIVVVAIRNYLTSEESTQEVTRLPVTPLPAPSSIEFTVVENNLEITWEEPEELSRCQLKYKIEIDTDEIPIVEETVENNRFSIQTNSFCLRVDVRITTIFDETDGETAESSYIDPGVTNLNIYNVESTNNFIVSWDEHVNQIRCGLSYRVLYRVLGVAEDVEIIHDAETLTASFSVEYCEEAHIVVVAVRNDLTSEESTQEVTRHPEEIAAVTGLNIIERENQWTLSWSPIELGQCVITYHIVFSTDLVSYPVNFATQDTIFAIPNEIFCQEVGATLYARLNEITSASTTINPYAYDILPVEGLTYSLENRILTVSWDKHPKEQACSLNYIVIYYCDGNEETEYISTTAVTFEVPLEGCAYATISVTTFNELNPSWVSRSQIISINVM